MKNHFISKKERLTEILQAVRCQIYVKTIYQFTKPFLDNQIPIFEEFRAFNKPEN